MSAAELPEPDRAEGAPHPRETARMFGQGAAERAFLAAYRSGRLHHGWLLTGPRGVGKATLAWRIARFLLVTPEGMTGRAFSAMRRRRRKTSLSIPNIRWRGGCWRDRSRD